MPFMLTGVPIGGECPAIVRVVLLFFFIISFPFFLFVSGREDERTGGIPSIILVLLLLLLLMCWRERRGVVNRNDQGFFLFLSIFCTFKAIAPQVDVEGKTIPSFDFLRVYPV